MPRHQPLRTTAVVLAIVAALALVICVAATASAGLVTPVFPVAVPEGTEVVQTKQQFESGLVAQGLGRVAAVVALVAAVAAAATLLADRSGRRRVTDDGR